LARPLVPARDPLSGFFCLSRQTWQRTRPLQVTGYKIALALLARSPGCRLVELPITFTQRRTGSSKLGLRQQCQYLAQLWRLYRLPRRTRRLPF
jgi:dolichol-phosphate mannosyltransferase